MNISEYSLDNFINNFTAIVIVAIIGLTIYKTIKAILERNK